MMGAEGAQQEKIDHIETTSLPERRPSMHKIGEEVLDPHIHDDHGDPHKAALEDADVDVKVTASTWAAVFFLGLTFLSSLSFTLNTLIPVATSVAMELQGNLNNVNWIAGGWSLAGSVSFAIAGQMSDYFGRKDVLIVGQAFLLLGHVVGASAQSVSQVIAGMVLLGVGTGTTFVLYAGISELLPNKWRSIGLATTEFNVVFLNSLGPVAGRALTQNATWRWIFILGAISGLIASGGTLIFYHPPRRIFQDRTKRQVLKELDYAGILFYAAGVTLFLLALGWAGTQYAWKSATVIAPLIIGIVLFFCTFVWDFAGRAARPLFPYRFFGKMFEEYPSLLLISFSSGLAHITLGTFVPQQINDVLASNPIMAGWYNVPSGFAVVFGGVILGGLVHRIKHVPIQLLVGNAVQTLACGLLAIITPDRIAGGLIIQCIANIPFGWVTVLIYVTAGLHVPQRDLGLAYGLLGASRYLGGAVGGTIFNTILRNRVAISVPSRVAAAVVPLGYPASDVGKLIAALSSRVPAELAKIPADVVAAGTQAVRWGYSDAFQYVWYASIPFGVIACIVSPFVLDPSPYFTNHTAVVSEKGILKKRKHRNRTNRDETPA